jgi:hypothetical protein
MTNKKIVFATKDLPGLLFTPVTFVHFIATPSLLETPYFVGHYPSFIFE